MLVLRQGTTQERFVRSVETGCYNDSWAFSCLFSDFSFALLQCRGFVTSPADSKARIQAFAWQQERAVQQLAVYRHVDLRDGTRQRACAVRAHTQGAVGQVADSLPPGAYYTDRMHIHCFLRGKRCIFWLTPRLHYLKMVDDRPPMYLSRFILRDAQIEHVAKSALYATHGVVPLRHLKVSLLSVTSNESVIIAPSHHFLSSLYVWSATPSCSS